MPPRFLLLIFLFPLAAIGASWWCWISPDINEVTSPKWRRKLLLASILLASIATLSEYFYLGRILALHRDNQLPAGPVWNALGSMAGLLILGAVILLPFGKGSARAPMLGWIITILAATYFGFLPLLAD